MLSEYNKKDNENQWFIKFYTTMFNLWTPLHSSRVDPYHGSNVSKKSAAVLKNIFILAMCKL